MALTVSLTIPPTRIAETPEEAVELPVEYPAAYARVYYVRSMAEESFVFVCWYSDSLARQNDAPPVKVCEYKVSTALLVGDIYPAAYSYLKSLPEFSGSVDC